MQGLHKRPVEVCKGIGMATRISWTLLLFCSLSLNLCFASNDTETGSQAAPSAANSCAAATAHGEKLRYNDPKLITHLNLEWVEPFGDQVPAVGGLLEHPRVATHENWRVFAPVTMENALQAYPGFKIYKFPEEPLQFQFNYYRGALTKRNMALALLGKMEGIRWVDQNEIRARQKAAEEKKVPYDGPMTPQQVVAPVRSASLMEHFFEKMYQNRGPDVSKHKVGPRLLDQPCYEIRFNHDPKALLDMAGKAERIAYDPITKEPVTGPDGSKFTTDTWFTEEVQSVVLKMIEGGHAYTVGVYLTKHHPLLKRAFHFKNLTEGVDGAEPVWQKVEGPDPEIKEGQLVGGLVSTHVGGVSTGLTLFMNRSPVIKEITDRESGQVTIRETSEMQFDGVGRMAFGAQVFESWDQGFELIDTVAVNDAAQRFGSLYYERPEYLAMIREVQRQPKRFLVPTGVYQIPFEKYTPEHFYQMAGIEPPAPKAQTGGPSKTALKKAQRAAEKKSGHQSPRLSQRPLEGSDAAVAEPQGSDNGESLPQDE